MYIDRLAAAPRGDYGTAGNAEIYIFIYDGHEKRAIGLIIKGIGEEGRGQTLCIHFNHKPM